MYTLTHVCVPPHTHKQNNEITTCIVAELLYFILGLNFSVTLLPHHRLNKLHTYVDGGQHAAGF